MALDGGTVASDCFDVVFSRVAATTNIVGIGGVTSGVVCDDVGIGVVTSGVGCIDVADIVGIVVVNSGVSCVHAWTFNFFGRHNLIGVVVVVTLSDGGSGGSSSGVSVTAVKLLLYSKKLLYNQLFCMEFTLCKSNFLETYSKKIDDLLVEKIFNSKHLLMRVNELSVVTAVVDLVILIVVTILV